MTRLVPRLEPDRRNREQHERSEHGAARPTTRTSAARVRRQRERASRAAPRTARTRASTRRRWPAWTCSNAQSHTSHAKRSPKTRPRGMNEMSHHAFRTSSRIVDDICGSQCACVRVPMTTRSPATRRARDRREVHEREDAVVGLAQRPQHLRVARRIEGLPVRVALDPREEGAEREAAEHHPPEVERRVLEARRGTWRRGSPNAWYAFSGSSWKSWCKTAAMRSVPSPTAIDACAPALEVADRHGARDRAERRSGERDEIGASDQEGVRHERHGRPDEHRGARQALALRSPSAASLRPRARRSQEEPAERERQERAPRRQRVTDGRRRRSRTSGTWRAGARACRPTDRGPCSPRRPPGRPSRPPRPPRRPRPGRRRRRPGPDPFRSRPREPWPTRGRRPGAGRPARAAPAALEPDEEAERRHGEPRSALAQAGRYDGPLAVLARLPVERSRPRGRRTPSRGQTSCRCRRASIGPGRSRAASSTRTTAA